MTPTQKKIVVTLGFCGLVSAADNWFVSPALPAIAQTLAIAPAAATIILTAYLTPYGLLQPVCGAIGDAVGRVRLLCIIVAGLAVSTVLCAAAPTLEALVVARIVTGCFAAGIISVNQSLVGSVVSEEDRQGAVGLLMGVTFTGQGLSAGLGGLICDLVGWRAAFICFGVLGTAAWLGVRHLRYLDETDGAGTVDAPGAGVNAAGAGTVDAAGAGANAAGAVGSAEREPFRPAAFLRHAAQILFGPGRAIYFVAFTTGIIFLGVYGFMGTFLAERCGLSSTQAGLLMMFYGLACLAGGGISGRIGEARGQRGVIAVGETSGVIATALLAASTITGSWMPALPAAACLGLGYILVQPTLVSFSMDIDPSHTGLCTGLIGLGVFAGGGIGSSLGGLAIAGGGYLALWTIAGMALVAQAIAGARFLPRK
ncbi:MFS transporter [Parolsenella catena]|uniref:MFS transporter n=1 Tax=Parolsenella catena TaxID=2003188 RepID=UPI003A94564D